jgi:hypothetical protein
MESLAAQLSPPASQPINPAPAPWCPGPWWWLRISRQRASASAGRGSAGPACWELALVAGPWQAGPGACLVSEAAAQQVQRRPARQPTAHRGSCRPQITEPAGGQEAYPAQLQAASRTALIQGTSRPWCSAVGAAQRLTLASRRSSALPYSSKPACTSDHVRGENH